MSVPSQLDSAKRLARGASGNPTNRFEQIHLERDEEWNPEDDQLLRTQFLVDHSATIIAYNDSPDIGFRASINPYRGCEHGCIYCYARPTHEYLGFSSGLDFESKIMVKTKAPELLRNELAARKWKPQSLAMSGVTDCYQPVERKLKITRGCLEVLAECRNPVGIVTKNALVARDIDVLQELAKHHCTAVFISLTTLDTDLRRVMEPRTASPRDRLDTMQKLASAGIPVGVMTAPIIPGLNDHEIPQLLKAAAEAGARTAGYVVLRLPYQQKDLFDDWLTQHFPDRKEKVLNRIRAMRGGKLYDADFKNRMSGEGIFAEQIGQMFKVACHKYGFNRVHLHMTTEHFRRPPGNQLELF